MTKKNNKVLDIEVMLMRDVAKDMMSSLFITIDRLNGVLSLYELDENDKAEMESILSELNDYMQKMREWVLAHTMDVVQFTV